MLPRLTERLMGRVGSGASQEFGGYKVYENPHHHECSLTNHLIISTVEGGCRKSLEN